MAVLSALGPDPRQPGYLLLEVDGRRFASLPADAIEFELRAGMELPEPVRERLQELADVEAACRAALRILTTRARARADLRRRLTQKQHPPAAVDKALARLESRGLLDDRRFAVEYSARQVTRGRGPSRLVSDLLAQGVERHVAEHGVAEALAAEDVDPLGALRAVAARRAGHLKGLDVRSRKRRLIAFLARRGYRGAEALKVVDDLCAAGP